jgi:phage terminase Nu1 subunit (DNA packaging protein)
MKNFITFSAYAKHRGVSRSAVAQAVDAGRIKAVKYKGKRGLDKVEADLAWEANTRTSAVVDGVLGEGSYAENRTEIAAFQAKLLKLKYDELSGELVPAKEIALAWSKIGNEIKNKMLGVPSKMKQRHADLTIEHVNAIDTLIREALEALSNGP